MIPRVASQAIFSSKDTSLIFDTHTTPIVTEDWNCHDTFCLTAKNWEKRDSSSNTDEEVGVWIEICKGPRSILIEYSCTISCLLWFLEGWWIPFLKTFLEICIRNEEDHFLSVKKICETNLVLINVCRKINLISRLLSRGKSTWRGRTPSLCDSLVILVLSTPLAPLLTTHHDGDLRAGGSDQQAHELCPRPQSR